MTGWHEGRLALFDIESSGPDPDLARIVTATLIFVEGSKPASARSWVQSVHEWMVADVREIGDQLDAHGGRS